MRLPVIHLFHGSALAELPAEDVVVHRQYAPQSIRVPSAVEYFFGALISNCNIPMD